MNILAVDDERDSRAFLSDLLTEEGHHVLTAASAREAEAALEKIPVDVVLLDLMMPGKDGFRFVRDIAENWTGSPIPLIAISCLSDEVSKACAKVLGCVRYIEKPVSPARLLEALREIDHGRPDQATVGTR